MQVIILGLLIIIIAAIIVVCFKNDRDIKKQAELCRKNTPPQNATLIKIDRSRYGSSVLSLDIGSRTVIFYPKNTTADIDTLNLLIGDTGIMYFDPLKWSKGGWLEIRGFSLWGQVNQDK